MEHNLTGLFSNALLNPCHEELRLCKEQREELTTSIGVMFEVEWSVSMEYVTDL